MGSIEEALKSDPRVQILDAAEARFQTYGYGKTTMVEIAEDVGMSAANLYRYFENKHDIAAACAQRCMSERQDVLRDVLRRNDLSAADKLRAYAMESFRHTYENTCNKPKINEVVEIVSSRNPEMIHEKIKGQCAQVAEILSQGNQSGEFDVKDVVATSSSLYAALTLFEVPIFMNLYAREEFESVVNGVVDLLLRGLKVR